MTDQTPIRVLLVDDQELVRTGFSLVLGTVPDIQVVGQAADGREAIDLMADGLEADVVCMDVRMPRLDGIEATKAIVTSDSPAKVLVLTTFDLDKYVYDALSAGASGFLLKDCGSADLIAGVRAVHTGNGILAPAATSRLIERFRPHMGTDAPDDRRQAIIETLSPREVDVLIAVGQGLTNQEIATRLSMAETTVKSHVGHLFTKLGARDRVHLVILAYDAGLATPRM